MSSPFPGMDPFLEDPAGWPDVHHRLITAIGDQLASSASPRYFVRIEERVYVTDPDDDPGYGKLVPDVIVTEGRQGHAAEPVADANAGMLVLTPPVTIEVMLDPEIRDRYLEVHDARTREVIAAIELLSPANKVRNSRGRAAMQAKRDLLRRAGAHWMEIDLLRAGERYPQVAQRSDYCVILWPAATTKMLGWFVDLRDRLPTVSVPLRAPDADVLLDLQQALTTVYDRAHYADSIDYDGVVPDPPLRPADQAWVARTIAVSRDAGAGPAQLTET